MAKIIKKTKETQIIIFNQKLLNSRSKKSHKDTCAEFISYVAMNSTSVFVQKKRSTSRNQR